MAIKLIGKRYYLLHKVDGKNKSVPLTSDHASSVLMASSILNGVRGITGLDERKNKARLQIISFVKKAVMSCHARAERSGGRIGSSITQEYVIGLLDRQNWRCAVTGTEFDLVQIHKNHGRPFAPSVDRIDSSKGYTLDNIRLVCLAANYAMNQWGESVLDILLAAYLNKKLKPEFSDQRGLAIGMDDLLGMVDLKRKAGNT